METKPNLSTKLLGILLVILPLTGTLCIDMYLPAYHSMANTFHVSESAINLTIAIYLVGFGLGQLIYGPLADRFGRRKPLIGGLILFCFASLICTFAPNFTVFLLGRLLQAMGVSGCIILCCTIITDIYSSTMRTRMLASIAAAKISSPALAPLLGGLIVAKSHWQMIFVVLALFGSLMLVAAWYLIPETCTNPNKHALKPSQQYLNLKRILKHRFFIGYTLGLGFLSAAIFAWVSLSPDILMNHFHVSPQHFGLFFLIPAIGGSAGALLTAKFSKKFCIVKHTLFGLSLMLVFAIAFATLQDVITVPLILVLFITGIFFSIGIARPLMSSGALAQFSDIGGFSSSIIGFVQTFFATTMTIITSILFHASIATTILLLLIPITLAVVAYLYAVLKPKHLRFMIPRFAVQSD